MTTRNMVRCRKCPKLAENDDGTWVCTGCADNVVRPVDEIGDEDCPNEGAW